MLPRRLLAEFDHDHIDELIWEIECHDKATPTERHPFVIRCRSCKMLREVHRSIDDTAQPGYCSDCGGVREVECQLSQLDPAHIGD